ncbi:macrophage mannose receptor 1 [Ictalurus punctatus]|uniref:Macrophage mannose receptor 1 n=1 Tax=Ictalurus punctatus TaxID=7998 RepID=A0A2D0QNR8_ICTPU|nr:macrophage mannose receptor 1 [Ictalurus punctatus]
MKSSRFICVVPVLLWTVEGLIREYIDTQLSMNWTDAQNYCANVYRGLAVVTSKEEYQRLREVAGSDGSGWIGMYRSVRNSSVWLWSDGKEYSYFLWMTGQPNNINKTQDCVLSNPRGWNDYFCWDVLPFYCYRFIILVEEKKTWELALDYCRTHYKDMASPVSESQLQLAEQEAVQNQMDRVWTGMRFLDGNWYWVNGKQLDSTASVPPCPASPYRCGARNVKTHVWENRQCGEQLPFLCFG